MTRTVYHSALGFLDEHIAEPRDMSTPDGAREFFMKSIMELLVARRHDE